MIDFANHLRVSSVCGMNAWDSEFGTPLLGCHTSILAVLSNLSHGGPSMRCPTSPCPNGNRIQTDLGSPRDLSQKPRSAPNPSNRLLDGTAAAGKCRREPVELVMDWRRPGRASAVSSPLRSSPGDDPGAKRTSLYE